MASDTSSSAAESAAPSARRRGLPTSLRWRIAASVSGVLLALILGQAAALLGLYEEMERDFIDAILDQQLAYSIEVSHHSPQLALPNTPTMTLYRQLPGEATPEDLPASFAGLGIGNHEIREGHHEYHVAVREADGARYILRYDESEHEARVRAVRTAVVIGALIMGLLVLLLVNAIAGRLSRGLERLAARVGEGRGTTPFAQPGMERELLAVARALDAAAARQDELLARERAFSANLSHELRTPLAGIRSDAEMIAAGESLPEPVTRRAGRIVATTDAITELAESLLLLARDARPQMREAVNLAEAARAAWSGLSRRQATATGLELRIPGIAAVDADPALLRLVLRNLLENALKHAEGTEVTCVLEGTRLQVLDRGPGLPQGDPGRIFDRYHQAGDKPGHGLGLALVKHICDASGWAVRAYDRAGGGACFEVDFSPRPAD
jgi:signal transduction histidine kinase